MGHLAEYTRKSDRFFRDPEFLWNQEYLAQNMELGYHSDVPAGFEPLPHRDAKNRSGEMSDGILLDAGTNEMELLVFRIGPVQCGINVAKVREIIEPVKTYPVPLAPEGIVGTFLLREKVLTLIDLRSHLGLDSYSEEKERRLVIVIELNDSRCGIMVDSVEVIHRLSWDAIEPPSQFLTDVGAPVTAMTKIDDAVVLVLDLESLLSELLGTTKIDEQIEVPKEEASRNSEVRILVADDSPTIRDTVVKLLNAAGYTDVIACSDGKEAWDTLSQQEGDTNQFDMLLSDVEMPRMDGLHLTSRVKNNDRLKDMPVVLFSSLLNEENTRKGAAVGADAQVVKFKTDELIQAVNSCLEKSRGAAAAVD
jgi:two-component system chemotaxis response regulator CheV